ncbi:MAG: helix-turn-helix domain-containing protein [Acidobacteria bacterium]|nr:helix-turn-helix domain-containing protein [Acidobacteriota bacterium]
MANWLKIIKEVRIFAFVIARTRYCFLFNGIQLMKSLRFAGFIEMQLVRWINRWNEYSLKGSADVQKNGRPPILTVEEQAKSVEIAMRNPRISTPPIEQN